MGSRPEVGIVLVSRVASGPPAVPSDTIECDLCGQDCWISQYSGAQTLATARRVAGGVPPLICCSTCLETAQISAGKTGSTLEQVLAGMLTKRVQEE